MVRVFKPFVVLGISLITLNALANPLDLNILSDSQLASILRLNGIEERYILSLLSWREKNGWVWSYEELLLCGIPEEMLPWFRHHFIISDPLPPEDISLELADFLLYPLDLNEAHPSALRLLPGMTEENIRNILSYRRHKGFVSLRELLSLGWTKEEIQRISPFVRISPPSSRLQWHHAFRIEGTNTLYRTTLFLPFGEGYLLLPRPHTTLGNISTIQTQAVMGVWISSSWGKCVVGDFRYFQGSGLLFGRPFSIISRDPSEMIPRDYGFSRVFSPKRDQNNNRYDEIFRGVAGEGVWDMLSLGGLWSSHQSILAGLWAIVGQGENRIGLQGFQFYLTNTPLFLGSLFGQASCWGWEAGGEITISQEKAWLGWLRKKGKHEFALVAYQGDTNFPSFFSGALYRGITGRTGILASLKIKVFPWECLVRGEWYTNAKTFYHTTKWGIEPAFVQKVGYPLVGMKRISFPFSLDYRTNQAFASGGVSVEGWVASLFSFTTKAEWHHDQHAVGSEYHLRTSVGSKSWHFSLWYSLLSPLKTTPLSLTFPPIESEEMESFWFYEPAEVWCAVVRYKRKELGVAMRVLTFHHHVRFAMALQWMW
ncbi:MAG: helix-hairpin-helix domain-containing protein [Brevinematales bacterium]|nr:helix-hairpin-helix domain-containing protein [Brevinematales bacterium]